MTEEKQNNEASENLLPCPFCGGEPNQREESGFSTTGLWCIVFCNNLKCNVDLEVGMPTLKEAVAEWNKRSLVGPDGCHIEEACFNYRHDYGLMESKERELLQFQATEWLRSWLKAWGQK